MSVIFSFSPHNGGLRISLRPFPNWVKLRWFTVHDTSVWCRRSGAFASERHRRVFSVHVRGRSERAVDQRRGFGVSSAEVPQLGSGLWNVRGAILQLHHPTRRIRPLWRRLLRLWYWRRVHYSWWPSIALDLYLPESDLQCCMLLLRYIWDKKRIWRLCFW